MNIIVTGSKGYIGRALIGRLIGKHTIIPFDCGNWDTWREEWNDTFYLPEHGGNAFVPADVIVHCGAISDVLCTDINALYNLNVEATAHIANCALSNKARMIFLSSWTAIEPTSPYGMSKAAAELVIREMYRRRGLIILRLFNVWGGNEHKSKYPSIIYKAITGKLNHVFEDCVRDFVHLSDVISVIQDIIEQGEPNSGTWEVGNCRGKTIMSINNAHGLLRVPWIKTGKDKVPGYQAKSVANPENVIRSVHLGKPWDQQRVAKYEERWRTDEILGKSELGR